MFYSLKWAHDLAGYNCNPCDSFIVKSVREAAHRILGHSVTKKEPVMPLILNQLMDTFGDKNANLISLRNLSMCFVAYAGFFRFSELSNLRRSDLQFHCDHVSVHIRLSKTDMYREGHNCIIARTGTKTCPVDLLNRYLIKAEIKENSEEFIFRAVSYRKSAGIYKLNGDKQLSYTRAREIILDMFSAIGF